MRAEVTSKGGTTEAAVKSWKLRICAGSLLERWRLRPGAASELAEQFGSSNLRSCHLRGAMRATGNITGAHERNRHDRADIYRRYAAVAGFVCRIGTTFVAVGARGFPKSDCAGDRAAHESPDFAVAARIAAHRQGRYRLGGGCHPGRDHQTRHPVRADADTAHRDWKCGCRRSLSSWSRPCYVRTSTQFCCMHCSV